MTQVVQLGTITNGTTTAGPISLDVPDSPSANKRMVFFIYNGESSASGLQLTDVRYDSAGANTALTLVGRWEYSDGGTINEIVEIWRLPEASIQTGSKSFSWTKNGISVGVARQSIVTLDNVDQTTPTNGTNSANIAAGTSGSCAVEVNTDGAVLAAITSALSTTSHTWGGSFLSTDEIQDNAMSSNAARSIAFKASGGGTFTATCTLSGTDSSKLVAIAINADGLTTSINLTAVNGGSAITEGQTSVALVGTGLNATGAGARLRIVSDPATYQAMSPYSPSDSSNATATVPTLTSLPFSTASWAIEAIGTSTAGNDGTPVSVTLNPADGYSVVEIGGTPDLSDASLLSFVEWTAVATDQIHWKNAVTADGTHVTITVADGGVPTLNSEPAAMPSSVTFDWRAWSSADKAWTNWTTATFGSASSASDSGLSRPVYGKRNGRRVLLKRVRPVV